MGAGKWDRWALAERVAEHPRAEARQTARRVAAPAEIGAAILLAASPGTSYMTGSLIMADGGATAGKRV